MGGTRGWRRPVRLQSEEVRDKFVPDYTDFDRFWKSRIRRRAQPGAPRFAQGVSGV
jgi:hypothetical protein